MVAARSVTLQPPIMIAHPPAHPTPAGSRSGLNDLDSTAGQTVSQVQTAADSWKYYGLPKGSPGTLGLCRGGTGER